MRGLFTKVFVFFWVAQSLTFLITTLLIFQHHYSPRPDQSLDALAATLQRQADAAASLYETQGCAAFKSYAESFDGAVHLADENAQLLCDGADPARFTAALAKAQQRPMLSATEEDGKLLWGTQARAANGGTFLFIYARPLKSDPHGLISSLWFFARSQIVVAIAVCGLTTFLLVLFLTRPIAKLRAAARALASGELATRITSPAGESWVGGDELHGLIHDFNYMAERLELLVDAHKVLLRDVSHELRSPLARLSVALELTREEAPESTMVHLQRIERETGRLNLLIGNLLQLSAMESTTELTHVEQFDLQDLLDELLPDAEFEAQQRSCAVVVHGKAECRIEGTGELIYRAIENVVRNAIRYTSPDSAVEITVGSELRGAKGYALLSISDRGPGLPESELERVFRPFYRSDNSRQSNTGGFGIGLALAERAIRLHKGEIKAENRTGGGLTVKLSLPCAAADRS